MSERRDATGRVALAESEDARTGAETAAREAAAPKVTQAAAEAAQEAIAPVGSEAAPEAVVLVHGLWMPGWELQLLRRRLAAEGYRAYSFVYPTIGLGLDANADRLAEFVRRLDASRVHFVGHSLGGVLILRMFQRHEVPGAGRIVCLGSPLKGTHAGRILDANRFGRRIVGHCIHDLLANGGCGQWGGACELGVIAGDVPLGFGRLLGGLPSPNDGTVAVEETRIEGAKDHIVLHCTHMSMLWSPTVAAHVVRFLREGRFA